MSREDDLALNRSLDHGHRPSSNDHLVLLVPGGAVVGEVPVVAVRPLAPGDAHAGRVGGAAQHEAHLALVGLEGGGLEGGEDTGHAAMNDSL